MTTQVADKIWVSTFLKSGAEDLQRTFMKQKNEMGISVGVETVKFSTLHAEFLHCLKELKVPVHIMDMKSTMGMIRDVAKTSV